MNKRFQVLLFLLLLSASLTAQKGGNPGYFGRKAIAGVHFNYNYLGGNFHRVVRKYSLEETDPRRLVPSYGVFYKRTLSRKFAVEARLSMNKYGMRETPTSNVFYNDSTGFIYAFTGVYSQVKAYHATPLIHRYISGGNFAPFGLHLGVGPNIGIYHSTVYGDLYFPTPLPFLTEPIFSQWSVSLSFLAQLQYDFVTERIVVGISVWTQTPAIREERKTLSLTAANAPIAGLRLSIGFLH